MTDNSKKRKGTKCQVSIRRSRDRFLDELAEPGVLNERISNAVSGQVGRLVGEYEERLSEYEERPVSIDHDHEEDLNNEIKIHIDDSIKTHIDDALQTVLEMIDQKISTLEKHNTPDPGVPIIAEPKNKKFEFYMGLGIGLSLFVGLITGLFMRGIL